MDSVLMYKGIFDIKMFYLIELTKIKIGTVRTKFRINKYTKCQILKCFICPNQCKAILECLASNLV